MPVEEEQAIDRLRYAILFQESLKKSAEQKRANQNPPRPVTKLPKTLHNYTTDAIGKPVMMKKGDAVQLTKMQFRVTAKVSGGEVSYLPEVTGERIDEEISGSATVMEHEQTNIEFTGTETPLADLSNLRPACGVTVAYGQDIVKHGPHFQTTFAPKHFPIKSQPLSKSALRHPTEPLTVDRHADLSEIVLQRAPSLKQFDSSQTKSVLPTNALRHLQIKSRMGNKCAKKPRVLFGANALAEHLAKVEENLADRVQIAKGTTRANKTAARVKNLLELSNGGNRSLSISRSGNKIRRMAPPPIGMSMGHGLFAPQQSCNS